MRVLFVCTNNICRSPMAAAIFSSLLRETEWEEIVTVDSAGTSSHYIGKSPHLGTLQVLSNHGISCQHEARQFTKEDANTFDYILAMDERNIKDINFLYGSGRAKIARLLEYAPSVRELNVPDPYFSGDFEGTYQIISKGAAGFLTHIQQEL